jgi:glutamate dehydrogenase
VPALAALAGAVAAEEPAVAEELRAAGAGPALTAGIAALGPRADAVDLADVVAATGLPVAAVLRAHSALGGELRLDGVGARAADAPGDSSWVLAAKAALREQLGEHHRALTAAVLTAGDDLLARHAAAVARFAATGDAAAAAREDGVALLAVLSGELHRLRQLAA